MSNPPDSAVVVKAINETEKVIARQRAVISERASQGKPVEALRPVLTQMEVNLRVLGRMQQFMDARRRRS